MKITYLILILTISMVNLYCQKLKPEQLTLQFNEALIKQDKEILNQLLDKKLNYGHSNLWIEDKNTLINNNQNAYLIYKEIKVDSVQSWYHRRTCILRYQGIFKVEFQSKEIELKLHVLQVWVKNKSKWKLLARQSVKII
ncbi:MAG: nuclear transport factor 2 family protein [Saprospiraceae bacterium]